MTLRELRFTAAEIAESLAMAHSTVSAVLKREGLGRLPRDDQPANRYERARPGELIHIDVKKLARFEPRSPATASPKTPATQRAQGAGWEFVHVCVDDATRLAYVEILDDERAMTSVGFLRRAVAHFAAYGIQIERLMTDNGNALPLAPTCPGLPRARAQAHQHRALPTAHQRQGRALHPHPAQRLGLPQRLPTQAPNEAPRCPPSWISTTTAEPHRSIGNKPPTARLAELNNVAGAYS